MLVLAVLLPISINTITNIISPFIEYLLWFWLDLLLALTLNGVAVEGMILCQHLNVDIILCELIWSLGYWVWLKGYWIDSALGPIDRILSASTLSFIIYFLIGSMLYFNNFESYCNWVFIYSIRSHKWFSESELPILLRCELSILGFPYLY